MPRYTRQFWICWCGTKNDGFRANCSRCGAPYRQKTARPSERAVAFINPRTGERRIPPLANAPMPTQYQRAGFERVEIDSMLSFERATGLVHEASNYSGDSALTEALAPAPWMSKTKREELTAALVREIGETRNPELPALSSGPPEFEPAA